MFANRMFRDIFSSRSLLAGLVFFLLCVGSSFLYNWHVRRTTQDELAGSDVLLQHERKNETRPAADAVDTSPIDFEQAETPLETDNAQALADGPALPSDDAAPIDLSDAFLPDDFVSEAELAELTLEAAAPFNFKTTPEGFPLIPYWDQPADRQVNWTYDHKLVAHVLVKLWQQGVQNFEGGSIDDTGRVRPHYTNTLYVEWDEATMDDGTKQNYISSFLGPVGVWRKKDFFDLPPSSVHLINMNSPEGQGIDPYTFLTSQELP